MNIPEIRNDVKQGFRTESTHSAQAVAEPLGAKDGNRLNAEAVHKLENAQKDKQSNNLSVDQIKTLVTEAEKQLEANNVKLSFNVLEEKDLVQVEIVDNDGKVIRKIPSDEVIKLSESLKNLDRGFLDETS